MISRHQNIVEQHIMAPAGAHAKMIPRLHNLRSGKAGGNKKNSDPRRFFIRSRPHKIPIKQERAGRIDLMSRQAPAV